MASVLQAERVPIETLEPHPANPRVGDVPAIAESLAAHDQYRPIVVQRSTRRILAGNHTWKAAVSLGWEFIDVWWVEVDDRRALKILLADNRLPELATYDDRELSALLRELGEDLQGTGWTDTDVGDLLKALAPPPSIARLVADTEEPNPADFYPVLKVALPPPVFDRWRQWREGFSDSDLEAFVALLDNAGARG